MTYEYSCGAVIFTMADGVPNYLLVRARNQREGRHGFPKGHMEPGETETQTALREVLEETGLRVELLDGFRGVIEYALPHPPDTRKRVVFFLGIFQDQQIQIQESELESYTLAPFEQAQALIEFDDSRQILRDAHAFLTQ